MILNMNQEIKNVKMLIVRLHRGMLYYSKFIHDLHETIAS